MPRCWNANTDPCTMASRGRPRPLRPSSHRLTAQVSAGNSELGCKSMWKHDENTIGFRTNCADTEAPGPGSYLGSSVAEKMMHNRLLAARASTSGSCSSASGRYCWPVRRSQLRVPAGLENAAGEPAGFVRGLRCCKARSVLLTRFSSRLASVRREEEIAVDSNSCLCAKSL